jgi:2-polyprenyl-6-methoxyphenol hydroxylase-like FAD-dependent oxidoreductase
MKPNPNGIIVGAGIVGLCLALELHKAGFRVKVFEAAGQIKELGVGLSLLPHSVKYLFTHGLQEALDNNAIRTKELRFYCKQGKLIWTEPRGLDAGYKVPQYSIHRGRLQQILLQKVLETLGPDSVITNRKLLNFDQHGGSVTGNFVSETGEHSNATAEFLIGADGINSAVRQQLYPGQGDPQFAGLMLWRGATYSDSFLSGRSMIMAGHNSQKLVVYPLTPPDENGQQLINWVAELRVPKDILRTDDWRGKGQLSEFADKFRQWDFPWLQTNQLFHDAQDIFKFPMIDREPVPQWSFDRVTLAGDAAHAMYPNGSNGASQGIIDAATLARQLQGNNDVIKALTAYQSERLSPTAKITLDNRKTGPERVLQMVEDQCSGECPDEHHCVPYTDLDAVSMAYKKLAGFDRKTVNK